MPVDIEPICFIFNALLRNRLYYSGIQFASLCVTEAEFHLYVFLYIEVSFCFLEMFKRG